MRRTPFWLMVLLLAGTLMACAAHPNPASRDARGAGQLVPGDFAAATPDPRPSLGDPPVSSRRSAATTLPTAASSNGVPTALPTPATPLIFVSPESVPAPGSGNGAPDHLQVDGMIGQINGQPVYAARVFEREHLGETLARLATEARANNTPARFQTTARDLISYVIRSMLENALILGEAERDLGEQEQMGLKYALKQKRDELVRKYGTGSAIVADAVMRETTEKKQGLEETLADFRQQLLIDRYIQQKIMPRINVSTRDIERYYETHPEQFNPRPGRVLRIIRLPGLDPKDAVAADEIDQQLKEGKPFAQVAGNRANSIHPREGGLLPDPAVGERPFGIEEVDKAVLSLKVGEHSPRITVGPASWWIYVEAVQEGKSRPLIEVQQEIETLLRNQRYQRAYAEHLMGLESSASYTPIGQMTEDLFQIAKSLYAPPPGP